MAVSTAFSRMKKKAKQSGLSISCVIQYCAAQGFSTSKNILQISDLIVTVIHSCFLIKYYLQNAFFIYSILMKKYGIGCENSFIETFFSKELCVFQPKGYLKQGLEGHINYLRKELYVLRQPSCKPYLNLDAFLKDIS